MKGRTIGRYTSISWLGRRSTVVSSDGAEIKVAEQRPHIVVGCYAPPLLQAAFWLIRSCARAFASSLVICSSFADLMYSCMMSYTASASMNMAKQKLSVGLNGLSVVDIFHYVGDQLE